MNLQVFFKKGMAKVTLQHNGKMRQYVMRDKGWCYTDNGAEVLVTNEDEQKFLVKLMEVYVIDAQKIFD